MNTELENKDLTSNDAKPVLGDVLQIGNFVEFKGMTTTIYGFICRINENFSVDYVRESLTRWNASVRMVEAGNLITEDDFINRVKRNAEISGDKIPSTEEVKSALDVFKSNFDVDSSEIWRALNIT